MPFTRGWSVVALQQQLHPLGKFRHLPGTVDTGPAGSLPRHKTWPAKNARVEKQYEGDVVEVVSITGELRQIFSNLFANSLDAIGENGTIKLKVASSPGHGVQITIADNGKGIEPSAMPRIFEPLFTTKGPLGTGLGLWVTKQLVDKHGGSIRVRSSANGRQRGTTFVLILPRAVAAREQAAAIVPVPGTVSAPRR